MKNKIPITTITTTSNKTRTRKWPQCTVTCLINFVKPLKVVKRREKKTKEQKNEKNSKMFVEATVSSLDGGCQQTFSIWKNRQVKSFYDLIFLFYCRCFKKNTQVKFYIENYCAEHDFHTKKIIKR